MEIVGKTTHARVGLLGNPSDGVYGKTNVDVYLDDIGVFLAAPDAR